MGESQKKWFFSKTDDSILSKKIFGNIFFNMLKLCFNDTPPV